MIPEFRAWDRECKSWVGSHDITMTLNGQIYSQGGIGGLNITDRFDLYPYIHRKDKDGKKVYEGSLVKFGKHTEAVLYNKEKSRYTWGGWQFESLRGFDNEAEVIGHIAEDVT